MPQTRRDFLAGAGAGLLSFSIGGCDVEMTPQQARSQGLAYSVLTPTEVRSLEAFGEILVPGAAEAGLSHFIDQQLASTADQQLLMLKYLGADPPFAPFYRAGLAALESSSVKLHGERFGDLAAEAAEALVTTISQSNPAGWDGPPAPFFYFVVRNDAVDVRYGTRTGIESLGLPYMPHIEPPAPW